MLVTWLLIFVMKFMVFSLFPPAFIVVPRISRPVFVLPVLVRRMTEPVDAYDRLPLFQNSRLKRAWTFGMHGNTNEKQFELYFYNSSIINNFFAGGTIPYIMSVACKEQRRECEECSERGKVMNKDCERVCSTFMYCVSNSLYPKRAQEINECLEKHGETSALCQTQLKSLAEE